MAIVVYMDPVKPAQNLNHAQITYRQHATNLSLRENACPVLRQRQRESLPVLRHTAVLGVVPATHVRGSRSQTLAGRRCRHHQATYCRRSTYATDTGDHRVQTSS